MMTKKIVNFAGFQVGWCASVFGASAGLVWLGPFAVALLILLHLLLAERRRPEVLLLAMTGVIGFVVDSCLIGLGVFTPVGVLGGGWICPPWLLGLWILFASTLNSSLGWLQGRPILSAIFGGIGGPLAYWAGGRIGAAEFAEPLYLPVVGLAAVWAILTPVLMEFAQLIHDRYSAWPVPLQPEGE